MPTFVGILKSLAGTYFILARKSVISLGTGLLGLVAELASNIDTRGTMYGNIRTLLLCHVGTVDD